MKVVACIKCFNEADYISESIKSIYPYVDKIIVIESCFQGMERIIHPSRMRSPGLSGDDTYLILSYLMTHQDPDSKIEYRPIGYIHGDQTIIYNMFVDSVEVGDYVWMVDADEVYQPELAEWIRSKIDAQEIHAFWLPNRLFWKDFHHRHTDPGWCRAHQRCYMKVDESAHYIERNLDVRWTDDAGNIYGFGKPPKTTRYRGQEYRTFVGEDDERAYYHYAYIRTSQRMLEKLVSQYIQNEEPLKSGEYNHCQNFRDPIEFKLMTHPWFTNADIDDVTAVPDTHPDAMKNHFFRNYIWNLSERLLQYEDAINLLRRSE